MGDNSWKKETTLMRRLSEEYDLKAMGVKKNDVRRYISGLPQEHKDALFNGMGKGELLKQITATAVQELLGAPTEEREVRNIAEDTIVVPIDGVPARVIAGLTRTCDTYGFATVEEILRDIREGS
jgi:hypothetical protein